MKKLLRLLLLSVFLTSTINVFAQTVYKSKAESKYHILGCKYLDQKHDSLDLTIALKKGFAPCGVCDPPTKVGAKKSNAPMNMGNTQMKQPMNSLNNASTGQQCAFVEKDGKRCPERAVEGTKYCPGHQKN